MMTVARVSVFAIVISMFVIGMSGCPGGLPSIVGVWSIAIGGDTVGVQFNQNGTVEKVDIGSGVSLESLTTWVTFNAEGIEFRQANNVSLKVIWIGTINTDGTMSGLRVIAFGLADLEAESWIATKLS